LILQNAPVRVKALEDMLERVNSLFLSSFPSYVTSGIYHEVVKLLHKRGI
jgi:hypothetical protein